jgi:hypothetical protein
MKVTGKDWQMTNMVARPKSREIQKRTILGEG